MMVTERVSDAAPWWINRNFVLLAVGQGISGIGDAVCTTTFVLAMVTVVAKGQPWAPAAVSALFAAEIVPTFVVRPFAGVWVDRWPARTTMLCIDALRALTLVALLGVLSFVVQGTPSLLLGLFVGAALLLSIGGQIFNPAQMKLLAAVVPAKQLPQASGISLMLSEFAPIIGPAIASALFLTVGIRGALLVDGTSFLVSLASLTLVTRIPAVSTTEQRALAGAEWHAGLRLFVRNRVLVVVALALACAMFGIGALTSLNIFFITGTLHAPLAAYGWITAAFSVGSIIGGAIGTRLVPRLGLGRSFAGSMVAVGACIILYAWMPTLALALVVYGIMGIPNALNNVALGPLVLRETPPAYIGRIFALLTPAWSGVYLVSLMLSGAAFSYLSNGHAAQQGHLLSGLFTITGLLVAVGGVFALRALHDTKGAVDVPPAPQ